MSHLYGKSISECAKELNELKIIHLHGQLGKLPWQDGESRKYNDDITKATLEIASKGIQIVCEAHPKADEFKDAFQLLKSAENIYFIGFAYDPVNLARLRFGEIGSGQGLGVNIGDGEKKQIANDWGIGVSQYPSPQTALDCPILSFLKDKTTF